MKPLLVLVLAVLAAPALSQWYDRAAGIIGILPLPEVFGRALCERFEPKEVPLFRSPKSGRPFGKIYVVENWRFPPEGGCEGLDVRVGVMDAPAPLGAPPMMEFSYEHVGAIVVRRAGSWFEIALREGTGWVQVPDAERFLPVEQVLRDGLTYLRKGVELPLANAPGKSPGARGAASRTALDVLVKVRGFRRISGALWVEVETLSVDPCSEEKIPVAPFSGWVPFHDARGEPTVWFYSRGC